VDAHAELRLGRRQTSALFLQRYEMNRISRREFVAFAATGATAAAFALTQEPAHAAATLPARDVIDRIKKNTRVEWKPETATVDGVKAGDPATVVTGIVTTSMATIEVLTQAVKSGANLVITCEPTFYSKSDLAAPAAGRAADPVFAAKNAFIEKNHLVVWRFHDHWRLRAPEPFSQGLADALGWSGFTAADDPSRVTIPPVTLEALASELKAKLHARGGIRVVGDRQLKVQRIGMLPGTTAIQASLELLPAVDVIIAGEVREWETVEYARDEVTGGQKKALITIGRVLSEDPGMDVCARWLKTIVPEIATKWIPAGDPYWRPV